MVGRLAKVGIGPAKRLEGAVLVDERQLLPDSFAAIPTMRVVLRACEDDSAVVDDSWIDVDRSFDCERSRVPQLVLDGDSGVFDIRKTVLRLRLVEYKELALETLPHRLFVGARLRERVDRTDAVRMEGAETFNDDALTS